MPFSLPKPSHFRVLAASLLLLAVSAAAQSQPQPLAVDAVQGFSRAGSQASAHAAQAAGASLRASVAVSAVPLAVAGSALTALGQASSAVAGAAVEAAGPIGTPLPVTDEVITVVPPAQALRQPALDAPVAR